MNTSGTLSSLPSAEDNQGYASLASRWRHAGFSTSLFASACSMYDAIRIAALASVATGGGNTSGGTRNRQLRATINATAEWYNGVSGPMALDSNGDLLRARFDVYAVDRADGWVVTDHAIDARALRP